MQKNNGFSSLPLQQAETILPAWWLFFVALLPRQSQKLLAEQKNLLAGPRQFSGEPNTASLLLKKISKSHILESRPHTDKFVVSSRVSDHSSHMTRTYHNQQYFFVCKTRRSEIGKFYFFSVPEKHFHIIPFQARLNHFKGACRLTLHVKP